MDTQGNPIMVIVGCGDYIGAAIARRFSQGGFTVCMGRRNGGKLAALVTEVGGDDGRGSPAVDLKLVG